MTGTKQTRAGSAQSEEDELLVRMSEVPACASCATPGLLRVRFRHSWQNREGVQITGLRESLLCPGCSAGNEAAALVDYLSAHKDPMTECLEELGGMVAAWVESLRQEQVDERLLDDQHEQWVRGCL
ncbi:DUF6300 family protein [Streptomyces coelicoflavus]|uniref:DUF6300 family protein n=1 Tax=Streptomyces coelicoflavus TaxID=285562 RepID=UPI0036BB04BB